MLDIAVDPVEGTNFVAKNLPGAMTVLAVANKGDRPIQVGSHFHFYESNQGLHFDRKAALGKRLDIPAGTAIRFEPGDLRDVQLVPFSGDRRAIGFNGLVNGSLD